MILGIGEEQVRIVPTACGGGFGGKLDISVQPLIALAAWTLGVPVRLHLHPAGEHGVLDQAPSGVYPGARRAARWTAR